MRIKLSEPKDPEKPLILAATIEWLFNKQAMFVNINTDCKYPEWSFMSGKASSEEPFLRSIVVYNEWGTCDVAQGGLSNTLRNTEEEIAKETVSFVSETNDEKYFIENAFYAVLDDCYGPECLYYLHENDKIEERQSVIRTDIKRKISPATKKILEILKKGKENV